MDWFVAFWAVNGVGHAGIVPNTSSYCAGISRVRQKPQQTKKHSSERREKAAGLIKENQDEIFTRWEKQIRGDIPAAKGQDKLLLRDHLAPHLVAVIELLRNSTTESARKHNQVESLDTTPNTSHGRLRATLPGYSVEQVIQEYIVLRQVITDLITQNDLLDEEILEIVSAVNENALTHAVTHFANSLQILRQKAVSMLMHDMKTPLNAVLLTAELVKAQYREQEGKMDTIVGNVKKVDRMVDELLDAVRLEAGQGLELQFTKTDLRKVLENAVDGAALAYPNRVELILPDAAAEGMFDQSGVARAVENLVSNGLKYGAPNEKVRVELSQDADSYTVSVHNWGEPIEDEDKAEIFVAFARSHDPEKNRRQQGWGLGLAYVKAVAKGHGGDAKVDSTKDYGTTFSIHLPRRQSAA